MVERKRKIFLNILKNFGIFHFTVERVLKGLGNIPTSKMRSIFRKRVPFSYACCDTSHPYQTTNDGKEMERNMKDKNSDLLPKRGNPLNETVTYKIGGTFYEISTVCGGDELLYDKMERLIKSETVTSPTDREKKVRYNNGSNLVVGRSLQEE